MKYDFVLLFTHFNAESCIMILRKELVEVTDLRVNKPRGAVQALHFQLYIQCCLLSLWTQNKYIGLRWQWGLYSWNGIREAVTDFMNERVVKTLEDVMTSHITLPVCISDQMPNQTENSNQNGSGIGQSICPCVHRWGKKARFSTFSVSGLFILSDKCGSKRSSWFVFPFHCLKTNVVKLLKHHVTTKNLSGKTVFQKVCLLQ